MSTLLEIQVLQWQSQCQTAWMPSRMAKIDVCRMKWGVVQVVVVVAVAVAVAVAVVAVAVAVAAAVAVIVAVVIAIVLSKVVR